MMQLFFDHAISTSARFSLRPVALAVCGLTLILSISSSCGLLVAADPSFDEPSLEFFEKKVRPILVERCFECHAGVEKQAKGGLRLDSRAAVLAGGDTGASAVEGKPKESLLIDAINYGNVYQMPPKSKLPAEEIQVLTRWVEMGLPWTKDDNAGPAKKAGELNLQERMQQHWAWQPLQLPQIPAVTDTAWTHSPLDRFILAQLESKSLPHSGSAEPRVVLRRFYFDLLGVPPPLDVLEEFEQALVDGVDPQQLLDRYLDQLLASPHYGERWGRHWLDLVRYAETRGHEFEPQIPNAWQYRDYVIRGLNADVPYDQWVREHLAGDLLSSPRLHPARNFNESILGTGFWFLGEEVHSPVDIRQDEADRLDNRLDVMTKTFLGLTVGCARCHDHKFDAISQKDYYALTGFLLSASYRQARFETMQEELRIATELHQLRENARRLPTIFAVAAKDGSDQVAVSLETAAIAVPELQKAAGAWQSVPATTREALEQRARERKLDLRQVEGWAEQIVKATDDPLSPLHLFAQVALGRSNDVSTLRAQWLKTKPTIADTTRIQQTLLDFANPANSPWYTDGAGFGMRSAQPGDVFNRLDPTAPGIGIVAFQAARRDPAFHPLGSAPGNEQDHGGLGGWERAGRSLRTLTVTLQSGNLFYLVRGSGRAYAVVDSHLVVAGPLHGRVLMEWDGPPNQWRWIRHDLTPYQNHRAHIEFTPRNPGEFVISRVVEADKEPALPDLHNTLLANSLAAANDLASLGSGLQSAFQGALKTIGNSPTDHIDQASAELANWMLERESLFAAASQPSSREWLQARDEFLAAEKRLTDQIAPQSNTAMAMFEGNGVDELLLIRGSTRTPGDPVPRRFLTALGGEGSGGYGPGSGRLELAEQLLAEDNPFTSRVMVNRVWHHLMGRGIVPTVDNFGVLGQAPTHPELLDWAAHRFRTAQHWSVKQFTRSVMLSHTYRMSSDPHPQAVAADPANQSWHKMPVRRLEAEPIRDSILAISAQWNRRVLGPPIEVYLTPFMDGRGRPGGSGPLDGNGRRSIYTKIRRNFLSPMMLAFDSPIPFATVGRRSVSNVPAQALILLNDPFIVQQATQWATRELTVEGSAEQRIDRMYRTAFARGATSAEQKSALDFLQSQAAEYGVSGDAWQRDPRSWADFAHVLFNAKELIFIP